MLENQLSRRVIVVNIIDISFTLLSFLTEVIGESRELDHPQVLSEDAFTDAGVVTEAPTLHIDFKVSYDSPSLSPKKLKQWQFPLDFVASSFSLVYCKIHAHPFWHQP